MQAVLFDEEEGFDGLTATHVLSPPTSLSVLSLLSLDLIFLFFIFKKNHYNYYTQYAGNPTEKSTTTIFLDILCPGLL